MAFPIVAFNKSSVLAGQQNGKLDPRILRTVPGQAGGASVTLVIPASRSWVAMCAAAKEAGHILKATSVADSYRLYEIQERIFLQRYRRTYKAGVDVKFWRGERWYLWNGAVAAAPGTSNHGWASAVDTGEEEDNDPYAESLDAETLRWLINNERRFGWSHELLSEPWHLRYWAGDAIPSAVLAYERSLDEPDPVRPQLKHPTTEDDMLFQTPSGSILFLTNGKIVLVKDAINNDIPAAEEDAQVLLIQASLPIDCRTPVPVEGWFLERLKAAFGPIIR